MADVKSSDTTSVNTAVRMKVDGSNEDSSSKQDNSSTKVGKVDDFKMCSPSNPFKSQSTNHFASEHNKFGKSILKPSLLSVNTVNSSPSASSNCILRQSSFNPFNKSANDNKSDNSDKKQVNGDVLKFVPLIIKNDSQLSNPVETSTQSNSSKPTATPTFVFGQNLQARVLSDANSTEPSPSTSSVSSNGNSSGTSDLLFSSVAKNDAKSEVSKDKETKTLTESAREYEESRANKRKYDEVLTKTGEEEETNILSTSCKLFAFDKATGNWQERGRGTLRLNDFEMDDSQIGSRLVFRTSGSLRVILNTKIWAEMTIDKASDKSIRLTALDSSGEIKVFLIMCSIDDSRHLYSHLQSRLDKEISLQKRKKLTTDDSVAK